MSDSSFTEKQLSLLRAKFYRGLDKEFFQDKDRLLSAIAFPAGHLLKRFGVKAPDTVYAAALETVTEAIVSRGMSRRKIERFSVYFLHCVQERMKHHGEEYYEDAKAALRLAETLPETLRRVKVGEIQRAADVILGIDKVVRSKGGRKKKPPAAQPTLF